MKKGLYRTIHCCIWADKKFNDLTDEEKLVWFHLLTNPFTTGLGIYNASLEGLAAHKKWGLARYFACFDAVSKSHGVLYDPEWQIFYISNFFRYNKPENPNVLTGLLKRIHSIPDCPLRDVFLSDLERFAERWGDGFIKVVSNVRRTL